MDIKWYSEEYTRVQSKYLSTIVDNVRILSITRYSLN